MILAFLSWYGIFLLVGWLGFPIAYRFLPFLPGRGFALSKVLGLLIWAFGFWVTVSLHVLQNDAGGILLSLLALVLIAGLSLRSNAKELVAWVRDHMRLILVSEGLFFVLFAFWAVVRAAAPEAVGTEKPMELAFIQAILRSPSFPPHDPWLSGYAISYYYFGYVMVAMLSRLTGVAGEVGFNLAIAGWFGLAGVASYGVLYELLASGAGLKMRKAAVQALLAPLFILLISNLNGPLEVLHAGGVFWQRTPSGDWQSSFWRWLDIQELNRPPAEPFSWVPNRPGGIWWWRSSRVLTDYDLNGAPREVIDEFPAFSFILGDLHPHVLAMPFGLLALGLALNLYFKARTLPDSRVRPSLLVVQRDFWLGVVGLGALAFLNTWDFPIYVAIYVAAWILGRGSSMGWQWQYVREGILLGVLTGVGGVLLYAPFYTGFASQAGGVLPSLSFFTRGVHFWVMFGSLLIPALAWIVTELPVERRPLFLWRGFTWAAVGVFGLWLFSYLVGFFYYTLPGMADLITALQGGVSPQMALLGSFAKRLAQPGMWLSMLAILTLALSVFLALSRLVPADEKHLSPGLQDQASVDENSGKLFVLLLFLAGVGLVLLPEFFYLRDQFGWRMNTIFKFYFQAWMIWGIVAGYASARLLERFSAGISAWVVRAGLAVLLVMGLVYGYFGVMTRTQGFRPAEWSIDGALALRRYQPEEYEAIQWLKTAPAGVVAEAVGGSYTEFARVATFSGDPTVLGWPGHESQWRGGAREMGSREKDVELLYTVPDWETARSIIVSYNIRYIYVGSLEWSKYRVREEKFQTNMRLIFQNASVRIYEAPASLYEKPD
ncbi:MAG TPA: hypothetical protein DEQ80_00505 [Anaerolinea thermolimosa]|uniref:YYY membrane protein n=1 Tax=Anaerolinea thermolimosa TaxID=229919 RepID=A0A3D1JD11_9CHLR|nr:hypothetical protein [Anaerolinea thermolimosa]